MTYKVIENFADLQDKQHVYLAGDTFPRKGVEVSDERIAELSGSNNRIGIPLIEKVVTEDEHDDGVVPEPQELVRPRSKKVARKRNNDK